MLRGTCKKCKRVFFGWALQEEKHQRCECGEKMEIKESTGKDLKPEVTRDEEEN